MSLSISIPDDLTKIIPGDERIIWVGRPSLKPFILKNLAGLVIPLIFLLIPIPFIGILSNPPISTSLSLLLFLLVWYGIVGFSVFSFSLYPILLWRNLYYILTDRRIIVRKGVVGIDYDILELGYVQQVNLDRGLWDKLYDTGTIIVQAIGVKPIEMHSIPNPFRSIEILRRTVENFRASRNTTIA